jgi:hypothetical protein
MKPIQIMAMLDLALAARKAGKIFNPMFTGEAGLGKSEICQAWVKKQRQRNPNFGFRDFRIAYMEAPDLIGLPEFADDKNGQRKTFHRTPDFWPTEGEGLLLLEEPNRGTTGVMNCLMQLLTDRKVHNYELPEGWIIAACVNPDQPGYDVNSMDVALRNRFDEFVVEFDHISFMDYIENAGWHDSVVRFVGSGQWTYKTSDQIKDKGTYISPRTFSKLNAVEVAGAQNDRQIHRMVAYSVLGKDIGQMYHEFCYDNAPVTAQDLIKDKKSALKRLKDYCTEGQYQGDMVAQTVESVIKHYGGLAKDAKADQINEDVMVEVAKIIPPDQAVNLLRECGFKAAKGQITTFFKDFVQRHPDMAQILKANLTLTRATGGSTK